MRRKTDKIVRSWKASPDDMRVLVALEEASVEISESDRVRAGLRALAREKGIPA